MPPAMEPGSVKQSSSAPLASTELVDPAVASITHELRTPLQAILGFAQLARMDWPEGVDARYLQQIELAAHMMLRSVNDLLDLGHLETGQLQIEPDQDLDMSALFAELKATGDSLRQDKPLDLEVCVDADCPRHLRGDAKRIQQVLLNLLANALRFTDRGRVTLQARVVGRRAGDVCLRLLVSDTGVGMAAADLARAIGQEGDQPVAAVRRSGAGFGLRIVRRLLTLMDSRLQGVSVPGGGTLLWFELWLPALNLPAGSATPETSPAPPSGLSRDPMLEGMKVLVVEDNSLNRLLMCDLLHRMGVVAEVAVDTRQARDRLVGDRLDALLCDMQLPDGSGVSLLRWLRQQRSAQAQLPTLFMSAHLTEIDRRSADALGAVGCLLKPLDPHVLMRLLIKVRSARGATARVTPRTAAGLEALSGVNLQALFLSEWPALRMAIQRADSVDALRKAVHAVRGSLAVLGASESLKRARELEEALLNGSEPEGGRADLIRTIDAIEAGQRAHP